MSSWWPCIVGGALIGLVMSQIDAPVWASVAVTFIGIFCGLRAGRAAERGDRKRLVAAYDARWEQEQRAARDARR